MKLKIQKDAVLEKINTASKFTSNRLTSSIILQGVYFKGDKQKIFFYSTNLNTYYKGVVELKHEEKFEVVLEPKKIIEFLNLLQPGEIEIDFRKNLVVMSQGKTRGSFQSLGMEEFPFPPTIKEEEEKIDTTFLAKNLPLVLFASSSDQTRANLTGINFLNSEGEIAIVSTDGFRLSLVKQKAEIRFPSIIIPGEFLAEIVRIISSKEKVGFTYSPKEKIVLFRIGGDEFYSRLIEGEFPPFEKVIPTESKTKVETDKTELIRNVKLISLFARDYSNIIVLEFKKDTLVLRPKKGAENENVSQQEEVLEGEEQTVALNYKFLLDFLNHTDGEKIIIEVLRPDAPIVFKTEKDKNFLHIIMPVRIQEE